MADLYKQGYDSFNPEAELQPEYVKQQAYQFRVGYLRAKTDYENAKNTSTIPLTLYPVNRDTKVFNVTYDDIMTVTKRPRTRKLHKKQLYPVLSLLVSTIEKNMDEYTTYSDMVQMVNKGFDIILQFGYDEGVLTETDLLQYDFVPVKALKS